MSSDATLEIRLGALLRQHGLTLATAESCSGGLIANRITEVPGSSEYFLGGVVAYANEIKIKLLGVAPQTLAAHGAVSQETVLEMAAGARQALGADLAVSVSGIAGPDGGTSEKPVGTVWIGISTPKGERAHLFHFAGNRSQNKSAAAEAALQMVLDYLVQ